MRTKIETLNEEIVRIKSLFNEKRLYGNLVEQEETPQEKCNARGGDWMWVDGECIEEEIWGGEYSDDPHKEKKDKYRKLVNNAKTSEEVSTIYIEFKKDDEVKDDEDLKGYIFNKISELDEKEGKIFNTQNEKAREYSLRIKNAATTDEIETIVDEIDLDTEMDDLYNKEMFTDTTGGEKWSLADRVQLRTSAIEQAIIDAELAISAKGSLPARQTTKKGIKTKNKNKEGDDYGDEEDDYAGKVGKVTIEKFKGDRKICARGMKEFGDLYHRNKTRVEEIKKDKAFIESCMTKYGDDYKGDYRIVRVIKAVGLDPDNLKTDEDVSKHLKSKGIKLIGGNPSAMWGTLRRLGKNTDNWWISTKPGNTVSYRGGSWDSRIIPILVKNLKSIYPNLTVKNFPLKARVNKSIKIPTGLRKSSQNITFTINDE